MERKYRFIYDQKREEEVRQKVLPLIKEIIEKKEAYNFSEINDFNAEEPLLFYLSDVQIKKLVPKLSEANALVASLPHPEGVDASTGWGVDFKLENAAKDLKESKKEAIAIDILYCNAHPVFNNLIIGQTFQLTTSNYTKSLTIFKRLRALRKSFFSLKPFRIEVEIPDKEKKINTAVAGIVVVQHRKNSLFSRLVLNDSSVADGMMHAFLISPRSLLELIGFFFKTLMQKDRFPSFGAHIKTQKLIIKSKQGPVEFAQDGSTLSAQEIELEVKSKQFRLIPGNFLQHEKDLKEPQEIYKTDALPRGEAAEALCEHRLPLIKRASTDEFKELFQVLRDNSQPKGSYLVLMVLSTILATFGLFANSGPVVIGAMILAPLMAPIISISMATLRQDKKLFLNALKTIGYGLGLSILFAIVITLFTPIYIPNAEILARIKPNLLDLGIAVVSGVAGAYAHAREEVAKTLAGVAIAVALVPPLAVAGIGLGWWDMEIFLGAGLLLITNLVGMVLAAALTFMVLGFTPIKIALKGVITTFVSVLVLCVPLAFSFNRMVHEHKIIQQLNNWETEKVILKDINVQRVNPTAISLTMVSEEYISEVELDNIKKEIEKRIGLEVQLEIKVALRK